MTVDKAALLARRADTGSGFPEADVDVPGLGTVRVRGLSRHEVIHLQAVQAKGALVMEQVTVSLGMVDPQMTEAEVKQWQRVSVGGEMDAVTAAIGRLSGMFEGANKTAYEDFEADPGSEFRLLPGTEAGDDGGGTPDPDLP